MAYRLVGRAEDRIAKILVDSARRHGFDAAARYNHLILMALDAIGNSPHLPGRVK